MLLSLFLCVYNNFTVIPVYLQFQHEFKTLRQEENRALLGCYAPCTGNFLPNFRDSLSNMGAMGCSETSVWNHHYSLVP